MNKNVDGAKFDVKKFLISTNRPYSCNDVVNNFQNQYNKTIIQKALDALVSEENEVREKINGKQKIYFISQDKLEFNEDSLKQAQSNIEQHIKAIEEVKQSIKEKQEKLKMLKTFIPIKELQQQLEALRDEVSGLKKNIRECESKCSKVVSSESIDSSKLKLKRKKLIDEWKKRKRMATEMIDMIMENYSKSKKAFIEEVGIETDEECNAIFPNI